MQNLINHDKTESKTKEEDKDNEMEGVMKENGRRKLMEKKSGDHAT